MYTSLRTKEGWYEDKKVFQLMKDVVSQLGRLADERPPNLGSGYIVNRPELLRHVIRCWSPCGCCVTYMSQSASVLTQCEEREHDFDWSEAERAIQAFLEAETGEQSLAIVKIEKTAKEVKEGTEDGTSAKLAPVSEPETQRS